MMDEQNAFSNIYSEPDQNALANMPDKEFDALQLTPQEQQEFETWYAGMTPEQLPQEARRSKAAAYKHFIQQKQQPNSMMMSPAAESAGETPSLGFGY